MKALPLQIRNFHIFLFAFLICDKQRDELHYGTDVIILSIGNHHSKP
jgi:hypothetical protein